MGKIQQRVLPRILTCVPFSATSGAGARSGHHIITMQSYKLFPNQPKTKSRLKLCFIKKLVFLSNRHIALFVNCNIGIKCDIISVIFHFFTMALRLLLIEVSSQMRSFKSLAARAQNFNINNLII